MKFPVYPQVSLKNFSVWNEKMFILYNNERIYKHPNPIIRFIESRRVLNLINLLKPLHQNEKILAAGCGEGYIEKNITTGQLYLVDLSKEAVKRAKSNLAGQPNIQKIVYGDLEKLPFAKNFFDAIECSEVIEHVYHPEKMLSEFERVLKKNGRLIISFPNESLINNLKLILIKLGLFYKFFPHIPDDMVSEWHLRAMSLNYFRLLIKNHWQIVEILPSPWNFLPVRYVVKLTKTQ